jgi:hypothetical protein
MTKRNLLTMTTILTVLGLVVTIKPFIPATSVAMPQAATIPARPIAMSQPATMEIVPAPVIDPKAAVFIGTGDRSAGSWIKPLILADAALGGPVDHD